MPVERPVLLSQVCLLELRDETLSLAGVTLSLRHVADERVYTQLQLLVARVRSLQLPLQLVRTRSLLALTLQLALRTVGTLGTLLPLLRLGRLRGVRREVLREVVCSLRRGGGERAVVRKAPAQVDVLGVGRYLQRVR